MQLSYSQKGFTMLEVLIAVFIVAIGVLGHSKMQLKSNNMVLQAGFAQSANIALLDLAHRIRVNPEAAIADQFIEDNLSSGDAPNFSVNCVTSNCTSVQTLVEYELNEWFTALDRLLPDPRFKVTREETLPGHLISICLVWNAVRNEEDPDNCDSPKDGHQNAELNVWLP
jgi:type IV pilus assembly protein PilV